LAATAIRGVPLFPVPEIGIKGWDVTAKRKGKENKWNRDRRKKRIIRGSKFAMDA